MDLAREVIANVADGCIPLIRLEKPIKYLLLAIGE